MRIIFNKLIVALALLVVGLQPTPAQADIDGSYCVGPGYAAIEARGIYINADEPTVYVVFTDRRTLSRRIAMRAPGTRNRTIHCAADRVILSDGTAINLTDSGFQKISKIELTPEIRFRDDYLPLVRGSKVLTIASPDDDHDYFLVLNYVENSPGAGSVFHHFSAYVTKIDRSGNFIQGRWLAKGLRMETVD